MVMKRFCDLCGEQIELKENIYSIEFKKDGILTINTTKRDICCSCANKISDKIIELTN